MPVLFVYGSLLSGESNHRVLQGSRLISIASTAPRYTLVDLGPYPALLDHGTTAVVGELYECDVAALARLDDFEGAMYHRAAVSLTTGAAEAYFLVARVRHAPTIASGDWRAYLRTR